MLLTFLVPVMPVCVSQGGEMLSLRYDLTVPFARFIAMHNPGNIKVGAKPLFDNATQQCRLAVIGVPSA